MYLRGTDLDWCKLLFTSGETNGTTPKNGIWSVSCVNRRPDAEKYRDSWPVSRIWFLQIGPNVIKWQLLLQYGSEPCFPAAIQFTRCTNVLCNLRMDIFRVRTRLRMLSR